MAQKRDKRDGSTCRLGTHKITLANGRTFLFLIEQPICAHTHAKHNTHYRVKPQVTLLRFCSHERELRKRWGEQNRVHLEREAFSTCIEWNKRRKFKK